jgi:hypothetical protein
MFVAGCIETKKPVDEGILENWCSRYVLEKHSGYSTTDN